MRPSLVVVDPPSLNRLTRIGQAHEPAFVQALVPEPSVEALRECILHRLPWLDERQRHAARVRPLIEHVAREARWREADIADSVRELYSTGAVAIMPDGRELWRGNFDRFGAPMPGGRGARFTPIVEDVRVDGNTAVMRLAWLIVTGSGGEHQRVRVTELRVWTREPDGRWRNTHAMQAAPMPQM